MTTPMRGSADLDEEKRRRVYYQDIVYQVCNELDRAFHVKRGERGVVAGTIDAPSNEVPERMKELVDWALAAMKGSMRSCGGRVDRNSTLPGPGRDG
jgi:hypothetical protein